MKKKILISGFGNIGFRYVEAILKINYRLIIYIHDKKINVLNKNLLKNKIHKLIFLTNLNDLPKNIDLYISAVTAESRLKLLKQVLKKTKVQNVLLEKVLVQKISELYTLKTLFNKLDNCFVNIPRENLNIYKKLKKKIKEPILSFKIIGGDWGLCSNSIHFIRFFSWISSSYLKNIDTKNLQNKFKSSKRKNFIEFFGKIILNYYRFSGYFLCKEKKQNLSIKIKTKKNIWKIIETDKEIVISDKKKWKKIVKNPLLSKYMTNIIKNILEKKITSLPSLYDVVNDHEIFLKSFINHYNKFKKNKLDKIPIT